ncbi:MAG: AbrB/MazE/SpoVT family DNA-binding domain-containing protein [Candidatus Saccharimonas sp.]
MSFHKNIKLAGTVTVGPKGQVVIPSEVRESMNIESGDKLLALYMADKKSVVFITEGQAQEFVNKMGEQFINLKNEVDRSKS